MSETKTNFLGQYFKKPQQTAQPKKLDKLRDEHPLFFKFATDPYFGTKIDETIDAKLDYQMNHITMPKDLFLFILKEFERLKAFENVNIQHDNQIDQLKHQIIELKAKNQQEKDNISRIKLEEEEQRELLEGKVKTLVEIIEQRDKIIKQHEEKIHDRDLTISKLKEEQSQLNLKLSSHLNEIKNLNSKLNSLYLEYSKYKNIVKAPLTSSQPTDNSPSLPLDQFNFNKIINLDYLFSEKYGHLICSYLDYKDILNLRLTHKFINKALNNDSRYYFSMAKQIKSKWLKIRSDLLKRLNIHRDLAAKIPDPFMKHLYSKYVRNRETIGEYMVSSVIQAEKFFNMILDYEETSSKSDSSSGFFSKLVKKIETPKPTNQPQKTMAPPQQKPSVPVQTNYDQMDLFNQIDTQPQTIPSPQTPVTGSIMDLYKNIEAQKSQGLTYSKTDNDYLEDPFELPEAKRELFASYYVNNPFCVFIQGDAYKNAADDKKQMLQKANAYVEDVFKALNKRRGVVSDNQDILIHLLQVYSKMLIFSKVLLQECKEMEALKDYTLSKYDEIKGKVTTLEGAVEDSKEAIVTEKRLKDVFSKKALDLEAQLHTQNVRILKDSEILIKMKNQVKTLEDDGQRLAKEKQDHENKVKVLVKEVKNLRAKNKELEETNIHVMEGYHDMKIIFDNLGMNLDSS